MYMHIYIYVCVCVCACVYSVLMSLTHVNIFVYTLDLCVNYVFNVFNMLVLHTYIYTAVCYILREYLYIYL